MLAGGSGFRDRVGNRKILILIIVHQRFEIQRWLKQRKSLCFIPGLVEERRLRGRHLIGRAPASGWHLGPIRLGGVGVQRQVRRAGRPHQAVQEILRVRAREARHPRLQVWFGRGGGEDVTGHGDGEHVQGDISERHGGEATEDSV